MKAHDVAITPSCEECGETWLPADDRRWRACRVDEPVTDEPPAVGFWCERCAQREFGLGSWR